MSPANIDTFYVLDFDRCIGSTDMFQVALEEAVGNVASIQPAVIHEARRKTEQSGGSFDTARFIIDELARTKSSVSWQVVCDEMLRLARTRDMLEPYARELLQLLEARGESFGILTYGGQQWQRLKLASAGIGDVPYIITSQRSKGLVLASWQQDDGTFVIPGELAGRPLCAANLVLIDDKVVSFTDIPVGVRGIRIVWPGRPQLVSQGGSLPKNVVEVEGVHGAIELLFGKDSVVAVDKT